MNLERSLLRTTILPSVAHKQSLKLLIGLKAPYGFALNALPGLINNADRCIWNNFLNRFCCKISVCPQAKQIHILFKGFVDEESIKKGMTELPLIKEGFLEIEVIEGSSLLPLSKEYQIYTAGNLSFFTHHS